MSHTSRCERSASDPKRCRCECGGAHHGESATPIDLGDKQVQDKQVQQTLSEIAQAGDALRAMRAAWNNVFGGAT